MKYLLLYAVFIFAIWESFSQRILPGGVSGVKFWEIAVKNSGDLSSKKSGKDDRQGNITYIDDNTIGVSNTYVLNKLPIYSIFTVNRQTDTVGEQAVFSIENDTSTESVITNKRLALLNEFRYANFHSLKLHIPVIYTYSQNRPNDSVSVSRRLLLGRTPLFQKLPVSSFHGDISELILYNRYLSKKEQMQVESYLALKYGISLNQEIPVHYLNSKGQIIWDADINYDFHSNIAGIGRDELSGLDKNISESVQTPGLLTIGSLGKMNDNTFLIWGDNDGELQFCSDPAVPRLLGRSWRINAYRAPNQRIFIYTNPLSYTEIDLLKPNEKLWLMIDRTGTGAYPIGKVDYYMGSFDKATSQFKFNDIMIDPDSSGSDVFTMIAAPEFFVKTSIISPKTCIDGATGSLQTEIAGGTPPFQFMLTGLLNEGSIQKVTINNRHYSFDNLVQGSYHLLITDVTNKTFSKSLWISNSHSWNTSVSPYYQLKEGESMILDASKEIPDGNFLYSWKTPDGEMQNTEKLLVNRPGIYILSVTDGNGCNSAMEVRVENTGKSNIKNLELFPNPTNTGWYSLRVELFRKEAIQIVVTDDAGKVLDQKNLSNSDYYWYVNQIKQKGICFISIYTRTDKETLKLLVQ